MTAIAARTLLKDFSLANPLYADASVSVFVVNATDWTTTTTLATLYKTPTGTDQHGNPLTLDGDGKWPTPVYVDADVVMRVTGAAVPAHDTAIVSAAAAYVGDEITSADAGAADALPATPSGYAPISVNGRTVLIPYFEQST